MTDAEVNALIEEFHMPTHVRQHCAVVADFSLSLAKRMVNAGYAVNLDLLRHAALLHDFVRVVDFREFDPSHFPHPVTLDDIEVWKKLRAKYAGVHHALAGAKILEERGFKDVANIVRAHRFLQIVDGFHTLEEKLLYYADKRVQHDKVVTLKQRLEDGRRRNAPETIGNISSNVLDEKVYALEREILETIGMKIE